MYTICHHFKAVGGDRGEVGGRVLPPFLLTHGQPQRIRSITSGPGILLLVVGFTGRCGQDLVSAGIWRGVQVGISHI